MQRTLSGYAASLSLASREGDDNCAVERALLAATELGRACSKASNQLKI